MLLDRMLEWLHPNAVSAPPGGCSPPGPSSSTFIRWWCPSAGPGSDSLRRGSKRPRAADPDPDLESAPRTKTIVSEEAVPVVVVPGASVARSERARGRTRTNAVPVLAEQRTQAEPNSGDVEPNDYNNCTNAPNTVCGAQWLLLWTTAAYAPEDPTAEVIELQLHISVFFFMYFLFLVRVSHFISNVACLLRPNNIHSSSRKRKHCGPSLPNFKTSARTGAMRRRWRGSGRPTAVAAVKS